MEKLFNFLLGAGIGSIIFLIGLLLCLTGIGAIVGVPMIVAGIVFPFLVINHKIEKPKDK